MSKLKIAVIAPPLHFCGGMEVIVKISEALYQLGHDVVFFEIDMELLYAPNYTFNIPFEIKALNEHIEELSLFDICICTFWLSIEIVKDHVEQNKIVYLVQHFEPVFQLDKHGKDNIFGKNFHSIIQASMNNSVIEHYRFASKIIVVSSWLQRQLQMIIQNSIIKIELPISEFFLRGNPERNRTNQAIQLTILGSPWPWKGTKYAVESAIEFAKKYDYKVEINIFGYHYPIKSNQNQTIRNIGFINKKELKKLFQHSAVYIHAAGVEGVGLTCLEALAIGCPIALKRNGGHEEFEHWVKPECIVDYNSELPKAIVAALDYLPPFNLIRADLRKRSWTTIANQIIQYAAE